MEEENLVVGLDIGTSKICAAAGYLQKDGAIKITGFVEKLVKPEDEVLRHGEIENAQRAIEIIDLVLEELADTLTLNLSSININISNPDIFGQDHKGKVTKSSENKQIQQADVDKLHDDVRLTFKSQPGRVVLHTIPQDFYVNDVKAGEKVVGKFGVQIGGDFHFLTARTESLENLYYTIKNIKAKTEHKTTKPIKIENLVLSSIADSFSLLDATLDDKRNGVALVNIGAEMTDICVFQKNGLRFFKAIAIGGNAITNDLREAFNINFDDAEILKKIAGNIPSKDINETEVAVINRKDGLAPVEILLKNASLVVEWRLKEIAAIVKSELIRAGYDNTLTNGIILSGGTSSMGIIKEIFSEVCKIKSVRKGRINTKINFNGFDFLNKPKYSNLIGLLMSSYINLDTRLDNRILKHATFQEPEPDQPGVYTKNKSEKPKAEKPKLSFIDRMKSLIIEEKMDDDYTQK
jgi:cell division protein FtsA